MKTAPKINFLMLQLALLLFFTETSFASFLDKPLDSDCSSYITSERNTVGFGIKDYGFTGYNSCIEAKLNACNDRYEKFKELCPVNAMSFEREKTALEECNASLEVIESEYRQCNSERGQLESNLLKAEQNYQNIGQSLNAIPRKLPRSIAAFEAEVQRRQDRLAALNAEIRGAEDELAKETNTLALAKKDCNTSESTLNASAMSLENKNAPQSSALTAAEKKYENCNYYPDYNNKVNALNLCDAVFIENSQRRTKYDTELTKKEQSLNSCKISLSKCKKTTNCAELKEFRTAAQNEKNEKTASLRSLITKAMDCYNDKSITNLGRPSIPEL